MFMQCNNFQEIKKKSLGNRITKDFVHCFLLRRSNTYAETVYLESLILIYFLCVVYRQDLACVLDWDLLSRNIMLTLHKPITLSFFSECILFYVEIVGFVLYL